MSEPREYPPHPQGTYFEPGSTTPSVTPPPPPSSAPKKKPRRWLTILISVAIAAPIGYAIGATADDTPDKPITTLPTLGTSSTPKATAGKGPRTYMPQDGVYLVGENIAPGTYRNGSDAALCIWQRLRNTSGDAEAVITIGSGPNQVVTIAKTDRAFEVHGCGAWNSVKTP